jgi:aminomethyltransferase
MQKTALYASHIALGAKMTDFCDWMMPLQYRGGVQEHRAVRAAGGIFDLSHMGMIDVEGEEAEPFLEYLSTHQVSGASPGSAIYTVFCSEKGTCIDDLIVYKENAQKFFLVVNACNRQKDLAHLQHWAQKYRVKVRERFTEEGIIAVQGPASADLLAAIGLISPAENKRRLEPTLHTTDEILPYMHFQKLLYRQEPLILSRTGYTGERGYELIAPNHSIICLWEELLKEGQALGIAPAGLAARDTLRLEMGYALYGHELDDTLSPSETVARWAISWSKPDFLGKQKLIALEQAAHRRSEQGVLLEPGGLARAGFPVFYGGGLIGKVTSGTYSPSLNRAVAIVLLERNLHEGDSVDIQIREHRVAARIVKLPFYKQTQLT